MSLRGINIITSLSRSLTVCCKIENHVVDCALALTLASSSGSACSCCCSLNRQSHHHLAISNIQARNWISQLAVSISRSRSRYKYNCWLPHASCCGLCSRQKYITNLVANLFLSITFHPRFDRFLSKLCPVSTVVFWTPATNFNISPILNICWSCPQMRVVGLSTLFYGGFWLQYFL